MDIDDENFAVTDHNKRMVQVTTRLTVTEYQQLVSLSEQFHVNRSVLVRFSLLEQNQKIVTQVKGILEVLDRLGPAIGLSAETIARSAKQAAGWDQGLNELLGKHISLQQQLEQHMRKLIKLMGN
ncbi:hypothetical protein SNE25_09540 [Mucilaginibacter sabulilitoris]|uniref:Plasmid mobilization relaxosome protein MobC n=1 Tax=Mucilaginibacter sabulilitoris TaxID=1173583 RepID=A0ABZ0TRK5_9SPHI|nr:hypothetical protein [Mucilaginibacter sabulilitoris]WPU95760.1 hypothetical protein SNE25_09540 [Mucilaginibacter sabulilitoris]